MANTTRQDHAEERDLAYKKMGIAEARTYISQYLSTAEEWRYNRVMWAFGIMLGEIPADTPEPHPEKPSSDVNFLHFARPPSFYDPDGDK